MKLVVLGSAAGGGFPQWNCNCRNCSGLRNGTLRATARTQSSIAVSGNGTDWVLINASPDILAQIRATPALQPARTGRDTGIAAVMLMDAQIDHVTGLLMLREGGRLPLYCTAAVWRELNGALPLVPVLSHYCGVQWHPLPVAGQPQPFEIPALSGIRLTAVPLHSKAPPYSPHRERPQPGDNIGLLVEDLITGRTLFYAPGLGSLDAATTAIMRSADCLLVDGTFWTENEMIDLGFSPNPAASMGHLPQSGEGGMIAVLDQMPASRKILIHINNTNPILDEDSPQHATLGEHGIELAYDGMEISL